ncbi:PAS domain-containing protein (plasmid) [Paraburkholderia sp. PREW-6R]|uniref:PAS domain-containing protein n=1 Tax=Paraburkholderia sp. PREW-6R TaxID=3141544 RepID=UPI0031F59EC7
MHTSLNGNKVDLGDPQTILDSITDAFFTLNANWEFCFVNRQTEKTLGRPASDLLGQRIWEVYPGTVGSEFERAYRKAARERVTAAFCSYYPDHDRWYDVNVYPAEGGLAIYFRDVTTRMRNERRRNALFRLADLLRGATTSEEIIYGASQLLGETLNASRVGYGTIDPTAETLHVVRDWNAEGVESLAGTHHLRDYGSFIDDLKAGEFIAINDVERDYRTTQASAALKRRNAGSFVNVPVIEQNKLVAVVFVNHEQARNWTTEELTFIQEVAEKVRLASERLRGQKELAYVVADSERRSRLYETFLEHSPDLAYVFDLNHRFIYANKVLLGMWNRTWDEAIGKNCLELGYEPWHAEMHDREIEQVIATKQSVRGEVPFDGAYGRRIYEYIFVPVLGPRNEVEAIAGTTRDVTERKRAEQALQDANRRKDEFLAMLSHELRNPLAPIRNALYLLDRVDPSGQQARNAIEVVGRQVTHLTNLVDDLLDVTRIATGKIELERAKVDLAALARRTAEDYRAVAQARGLELGVVIDGEALIVEGDETRLSQVLGNLLGNAAKFTPSGGQITLTAQKRGASVFIDVTDNGVGIAPDLLPIIFDPFTQASQGLARTEGGLGLGLALVKEVIGLHGGSVTAVSTPGAGAQFTIELPLVPATAPPAPHSPAVRHDGHTRAWRILIVDDNADSADSLAAIAGMLGHTVEVCYDGRSAVALAEVKQHDVVLCDIGLPDMNGYEVAQILRRKLPAKTKLIAISGYAQPEDVRKAIEAGFNEHVAKPLDMRRIEHLLAGDDVGGE